MKAFGLALGGLLGLFLIFIGGVGSEHDTKFQVACAEQGGVTFRDTTSNKYRCVRKDSLIDIKVPW